MSIYFIRYQGLIKIGFSSNLVLRVKAIMASIPGQVVFLGHMPGDREMEAHLHERFEHTRFSGEWFADTEDLAALIRIATIPGLPEAVSVERLNKNDDKAVAVGAASARLRAFAAWPDENHGDRKRLLAHALGWGGRRIKSIYEAEATAALRQIEAEQLAELVATDARDIDD